ncbi:hypothetical protein EDD25_0263 [Cryobacterium psychrophilum]|nr:hypothetical protein EDD25_0263 [Cryobacterium psychrophilum]
MAFPRNTVKPRRYAFPLDGGGWVGVGVGFGLDRGNVADLAVDASIVEPVDALSDRFDSVESVGGAWLSMGQK